MAEGIPKRYMLAGMMFVMTLVSYMTRVNFSIAIVAMTKDTENASRILPDYGHRFEWSQHDQGLLLGSYFIGYSIISMPAGTLAEIFGGKEVTSFSMLVTSLLTALTPASAYIHKWAIYVNRLILGLIGGLVYPCMHNMISKWAPPQEKGIFMAVLFGGALGTVLTWAASGVIIEHIGWDWSFYITAIVAAMYTVLWMYTAADSPAKHKTITTEEREYIENSLFGFTGGKKKYPPYLALMTSLPFISLTFMHFGYAWGLYFQLTAAPKFLSEALHFNLQNTGFLSSLPLMGSLIGSFIFGAIGDHIRRKNVITVTFTRKLLTVFSHVIPGTLLIILALFVENPYVCVAMITFSLAFSAAAAVTNLINPQDLAPKFAGSLFGIINFVASLGGFISPMVVAAFTAEKSTIDTWRYVFILSAAIYIVPALLFWIFGSGEVQKWNYIDDPADEETKKT